MVGGLGIGGFGLRLEGCQGLGLYWWSCGMGRDGARRLLGLQSMRLQVAFFVRLQSLGFRVWFEGLGFRV